ncbi:hypothetical protein [Acinetobacter gyllenbergii]|uniref:hypothetical protein n=1 Tax=Acinetobacter gyllenbergii TaxID=134534 RepID=UPI000806D27A|nr:hypothetical protein [Acinetobacter gyllenbergii]OBY76074.1 hypothetical protein NG55_05255 [Acinetobacter gyllenbergii]
MRGNELNLDVLFEQRVLRVGNFFLDFDVGNDRGMIRSNLVNKDDLDSLIYLSGNVCVKILSEKERTIYILFNTSESFDANLLHSKILKRFKKKYKFNDEDFIVIHPARVALKQDKTKWNKVEFTYDPKQGDISLVLEY